MPVVLTVVTVASLATAINTHLPVRVTHRKKDFGKSSVLHAWFKKVFALEMFWNFK